MAIVLVVRRQNVGSLMWIHLCKAGVAIGVVVWKTGAVVGIWFRCRVSKRGQKDPDQFSD